MGVKLSKIKLGVVWSLTSHFPTFACYLNELTEKCREFFSRFTDKPERFISARIEYAWSEDKKELEKIAREHKIKIVDKMEDMINLVDGVLILTRYPYKNLEYAKPFIKAKIPLFIDKPFASNVEEAYEIVRLALRYKTPIMSTSALRYAIELNELRDFINKERDIWGGNLVGPGDFRVENMLYGIHIIEILSSLFGRGVEKVFAKEYKIGDKHHIIANVVYKDGKNFVLQLGSPCYKWLVTLIGKNEVKSISIENSYEYYKGTINAILKMIVDRRSPIDILDTLEVIRVCHAIQKSIDENGREIILDKEFPIPDDIKSFKHYY